MYCKKCGTQLPDDANFCLKCGEPQREGAAREETKWEICEILFAQVKAGNLLERPVMQFWASAYCGNEKYNAGQSVTFRGDVYSNGTGAFPYNRKKDIEIAYEALGKLEEQLLNDEWEYVGAFGNMPWDKRFRRRVE